MNKHLLVTISDDASAQWALKFVCAFFRNKADLHLTLFYTAPLPPIVWAEEKSYETLRQANNSAQAILAAGKRAMKTARDVFLAGGFAERQVGEKIIPRNISRIGDIIREGESGLYDAVVFGRRGIISLECILDKSATEEMLQAKFSFPVWVCRDVDYSRRGVLLCADDSAAFQRIADHTGFILQGERQHRVTLFRVVRKSDARPPEELFAEGIAALRGNGFPEGLIETHTVTSEDVVGSILKEAERGRYAAVAIGRPIKKRGRLAEFFASSVGIALLRRLSGAALWVSR